MEADKMTDVMAGDFRSFGICVSAKFASADNPALYEDVNALNGSAESGENQFENKAVKDYETEIIRKIHHGKVAAALKLCDELTAVDYVAGKTVKGIMLVLTGHAYHFFTGIRELVEAAAEMDPRAVNALSNILEIGLCKDYFNLSQNEIIQGDIRFHSEDELKEHMADYLASGNDMKKMRQKCPGLFAAVRGFVKSRDCKKAEPGKK